MNMCVAMAFAAAVAASAATNATKTADGEELIKFGKKMVTREYARDAIQRAKMKRTGGIVRKAGSAKGWFVLLDAQGAVSPEAYAGAVAAIDRQAKVQAKTVKANGVDVSTLGKAIKDAGGDVGVALVDDASLPALLGAPEEGWGLVNVAKLRHDDAAVFAARTRREILRAFGLAAGAMYAAQGDFVLQPVRSPKDLDELKREEFGAMMMHIYPLSLPYYGITQWKQATYRVACEEGWAPAPTNDFQKAIWNEVRAIPKNPMKIEFDPKSGR